MAEQYDGRSRVDSSPTSHPAWSRPLSRRRLLTLTATATGAALAGALLAACGGASPLSGETGATTSTGGTSPPSTSTTVPSTGGDQTPTTATQTAAAGSSAPSGQIIVGLSQEPTAFHPLMPGIEVDQGVRFALFSPLWAVDDKGAFYPVLAEDVPTVQNGGISEDGLTWTIRLRDNVKWHDGHPFSADDVEFSLGLIMDPDFKASSRLGYDQISNINVASPTEITWKMERSYAPLMSILASTFIVPKHILVDATDPNETSLNTNPIGTGPFVWSERTAGDHITLKANTDYFGEGPYVEQLVFKYIPDLNALYTQFKTGAVDYIGIQGIPTNYYAEAKTLDKVVVHVGPSPSIEQIRMNHGRPQFQDRAVREALYLAIDKKTIIDKVYYGLPATAESYLPQQSWAYNPDLPPHEFNPEKAIEILDAAGWKIGTDGIREKDGVKLAFSNSTTAGNQVREQAQQLIQQTWRDIGVALEIKNLPAAVVWGDFSRESQYDSQMVGITFGRGPDPDVTTSFASTAIPVKGGSGGNNAQYENSEVDVLLKQGVETIDRDQRKSIYQRLQLALLDDLAMLPLFQYANLEGTKKGLVGYAANPNVQSNCWNLNVWRWEK